MMIEEIAKLTEKIERLTERIDVLVERLDRMEEVETIVIHTPDVITVSGVIR